MLHQTDTTMTNTTEFRMVNGKDILPKKQEGKNFFQYINDNNGGQFESFGYIGNNGIKIHKFVSYYITLNNEKVVISVDSQCGSQSYKTGVGSDLTLSYHDVNCKKCK